MSHISIDKVRKIFHLDVPYPQFPTRREILEFDVDGVKVKAIATHAWRSITVDIIEPFQINAWTVFPPFIALGFFMLMREAKLLQAGMTSRDEFILHARSAYLSHVTYLKLKPRIDAAHENFVSVFQDDLQSLKDTELRVKSSVSRQRSELRRKLQRDQITQRDLQAAFKQLGKEASHSSCAYSDLKRQVDNALEEIKYSMVNQVRITDS